MRTRMLPLAPLAVLVALLGACGDDDEGNGRGLDPASPGSDLAAVDFTEDLGCGYGFAVSDEAQEALLSIHHSGGDDAEVDRTITLPDPAWDAEVRVGTHLAANWCADVIEDPQAEVEETWTVVEGTLRFEGDLPPLEFSEQGAVERVHAELTGVVVEGPDGEQVELGDISLSNRAWGVFAG